MTTRQETIHKVVQKFLNQKIYDVRDNPQQYVNNRARYKKYYPKHPIKKIEKKPLESTYERRFRYINIDSKHRNRELFPDANHYVVNFSDSNFINVIEVELVGSTFYNVHRTITHDNNKICWSTDDYESTTAIYEATIPVGNYKFEDILTTIQDAMNEVTRINGEPNCFVWEGDDQDFNITVTGYNQLTSSNCLQVSAGSDILTITYPIHSLNIGDKIIIENAPDTLGNVPAFFLNKEHTVTGVVGLNEIEVTLDVTASADEGPTGTDVILKKLLPSIFYFGDCDIGQVLGFGTTNTSSQTSHTNNPDEVTLLDNEYFLMCSPDLCGDFSEIDQHYVHIFAKIQNAARYGDIMFNSYVGGRKIFYNHEIDILENVEFKFQYEDGTLVDFGTKEHSFVLKVTELVKKSSDMHYNSKLGTFYNYNESEQIKEFSSDFRVGILT